MSRTSRRTATTGLAWEAVAPVVRWPLHSPRRLGGFLVAVVAIVMLLAAVRPAAVADPAPSNTTPTPSSRPPTGTATSAPTPPSDSAAVSSPPTLTVASSPVEVAVRFVTAWARPDLPVEAWYPDVIALATPAFGAQLRTADPRNVPARSVTGPGTPTSATQVTATVTVPTDAGPVLVDLAVMGTAWQVSGLRPASRRCR